MKSKKFGFLGFSIIAGLLVVLSIIMVGCTAKTTTTAKASLSSISVTVSSTDSLVVGATTAFKAVGTYSDNSTADVTQQVIWNSDNTTVATLAKDGTATAVAAGSANISASLSGITSPSVKLTVISLSSIAVTPASLPILTIGATQQFSAVGTYSDGSKVDITSKVNWVSDKNTATINAKGLATIAAVGTANITAALSGVTSTKVVLTAETIVSIDLQPAVPAKLSVRSNQRLSATAKFTDGSTGDISSLVNWTWIGSSSGIVSISPTGVITGGAVGTASITATLNGISSPAVVFTVVTP
jgi:hypothetical protein